MAVRRLGGFDYHCRYESSTELSGVYCLVDSQGNVVSSDLEPEDVIRILEELSHGENQEDQNP